MKRFSNTTTFVLIALGTVVGLAGTDLVLPAVPSLPQTLGGTLQSAQFVLAAFAAGTGIGLLVFGELGSRYNIGNLLVGSLLAYAACSLAATFADSLVQLSIARFFQGLVAAGPAVFAPLMIKSMYDEVRVVVALGRIGSIESMTPALAPLLGAWLLTTFGWKSSFYLTAAVALALSVVWIFAQNTRTHFHSASRSKAGYLPLLRNWTFLRHSMSQAFTLGALLIIVFAAPTVITQSLGGELVDFIIMQVLGVACFVLAANTSHFVIARLGEYKTILAGTSCTAFGCLSILLWGLRAESDSATTIHGVWVLFIFVNVGLGIRGPAGFFKALIISGDNDARGSALIVLLIMFTAAFGTAAVAPFVENGLVEVAALASVVALFAVILSIGRPPENSSAANSETT